MSRFWKTASAVPLYQSAVTRCCAGSSSMNSLNRPSRNDHPRCTWRIRLCALYCVAMPMRRMPELRQFESVKSMIRNFPPNGTEGLARQSVSGPSRDPRPPASTKASVCLVRCALLGSACGCTSLPVAWGRPCLRSVMLRALERRASRSTAGRAMASGLEETGFQDAVKPAPNASAARHQAAIAASVDGCLADRDDRRERLTACAGPARWTLASGRRVRAC